MGEEEKQSKQNARKGRHRPYLVVFFFGVVSLLPYVISNSVRTSFCFCCHAKGIGNKAIISCFGIHLPF